MSSKNTILLNLGLVFLNIIIGHFFAPNGILITPILIIVTTLSTCFLSISLKPIWKSLLCVTYVFINDFGIKLYSGGSHDNEGLGWIHLMMFLGLIPSFIILFYSILKNHEASIIEKIVSICLYPILITIHLNLFSNLGLGRYYWYDWN